MEDKFPKRKPTRLKGFDYNRIGAYFITICTENRKQILSRIVRDDVSFNTERSSRDGSVGGDVLDAPQKAEQNSSRDGSVGGDVLDAPQKAEQNSGRGIFVCGDVNGVKERVELLYLGKIAEKYINQMNNFYSTINVEGYVVMPNHIHIMLSVDEGASRTSQNGASRTSQDGASRTSPPTGGASRQHSAVSKFVSAFKRLCNKEFGRSIWQRSYYDHIIRDRDDYDKHIKYIYENPMRWYFDELYAEE